MKIFSLETKKHLVGWSLVVGIITSVFVNKVSFIPELNNCVSLGTFGIASTAPVFCFSGQGSYGFPIRLSEGYTRVGLPTLYERMQPFINNLFWIISVFIVLSLIRHFRNKNEAIHPRTKI